ncbi:AhpC/TSA family protein [Gammaproteobacteria bacterium]|nr:AhpC/TSA family protein [Gammaproteobacteria bacterium]
MTLNKELTDVEADIVNRNGIEITALFEQQIDAAEHHLRSASIANVGNLAKDFSLVDTKGKKVTLSEVVLCGPVILTFYRGSWCNFCNAALKFWDRYVPEIEARGSRLFAIAPEKIETCREFKAASGLRFDLLSDSNNDVAAMYGLVYELPKEAKEKLSSFGTDVGIINGNGSWEVPVTATYVIGKDQRVMLADCGPDYRKRLEPEAVLAALQ